MALDVVGAVTMHCLCAPSLQGGVSDEVTLSAYITAAFLEMNTSIHVSRPPAVQTADATFDSTRKKDFENVRNYSGDSISTKRRK